MQDRCLSHLGQPLYVDPVRSPPGLPAVALTVAAEKGVKESVRKRGVWLAVVAVLAAAGYLFLGRGRELQGAEARQLVAAGARLLDVRSPGEFDRGHLPGAINVPVQELEARLTEVGPPDHDVVVYCRSGHRSTNAAELLRRHGFTKVHNLGPMTAW
jgi:rhodanese-related sulfurtransferase